MLCDSRMSLGITNGDLLYLVSLLLLIDYLLIQRTVLNQYWKYVLSNILSASLKWMKLGFCFQVYKGEDINVEWAFQDGKRWCHPLVS